MSTVFVSHKIWPELKRAVSDCYRPCAVAVAYVGKGASRLIPLPPDSRLVVDASERAVKSGLTCPADLLALVNRGVAVYTVPNLHAKVFVLGRAAYIGSANVSSNSATTLVEALIRTTSLDAVRAAREFVLDNCIHELTPSVLRRLAKIYRPPRVPAGAGEKRRKFETAQHPTLPRLLLAQLERQDWSDSDQAVHDAGLGAAKKRRKHLRNFTLESFRWSGKCPFKRDDVVIQITDEENGAVFVDAPGNILHVRTRRDRRVPVSFVYLERPSRRRRQFESLSKKLGRGSRKRLRRQGAVRNPAFTQALLNLWNR